jgi:ABC-type cobalamin/Fe3+-siderophores transport system ATPase subunit
MPAAVVTEQIERRFDEVVAVDGVDLEVREGEIYGFLGPNGAGKSTIVRMLCTLLLPTAGRALVLGHDVATEPGQLRLRIGLALETVATYNPVTYLLAGLRSLVSKGWDGADLLQAIAAVAAVGLVSISLALAALRGRVQRG